MKSEELFGLISEIDEQKIPPVETVLLTPIRPSYFRRICTVLMCVCLLGFGIFLISSVTSPKQNPASTLKQDSASAPTDEFAFLKDGYFIEDILHPSFAILSDHYQLPEAITKIQVLTRDYELVSEFTDSATITAFYDLFSDKEHTNLSSHRRERLHYETAQSYKHTIIIRLENNAPLVMWYYPTERILECYGTYDLTMEEANTLTYLLEIPFAYVTLE